MNALLTVSAEKFLFYFAAWLSPQREEKEAQLDEGGSSLPIGKLQKDPILVTPADLVQVGTRTAASQVPRKGHGATSYIQKRLEKKSHSLLVI